MFAILDFLWMPLADMLVAILLVGEVSFTIGAYDNSIDNIMDVPLMPGHILYSDLLIAILTTFLWFFHYDFKLLID